MANHSFDWATSGSEERGRKKKKILDLEGTFFGAHPVIFMD